MIKEKEERITCGKTLDDEYTQYVIETLRKSEEGIKKGKVISLEELKDFVDRLVGRK